MTSPGSDPAQPAAARIYDYLLGGKDNYAVDRAAADRVLAAAPDQRRLARVLDRLGPDERAAFLKAMDMLEAEFGTPGGECPSSASQPAG